MTNMIENSDTLLSTLVVFGLVSLFFFLILTRSQRLTTTTGSASTSTVANASSHLNARGRTGNSYSSSTTSSATNTTTTSTTANSTTATATTTTTTNHERCWRLPSHVSSNGAKIAADGGSNIIVDGVVAFRYTKAVFEEQNLTETERTENRNDRAHIFSRLLDVSLNGGVAVSAPPAKGTTIVIAFAIRDVGCTKLRRILYLLGSYYNLFAIIVVEQNEQFMGAERDILITRLRGEKHTVTNTEDDTNEQSDSVTGTRTYLSCDVLPSHRIIATTTTMARVAFVRQLERIELMIDYDDEVKKSLSRFGHKVVVMQDCINNAASINAGTSQLGMALL